MKFKLLGSLIISGLLFSCTSKNPFTGKNNLNFVSNDQIFPTSFQQYQQFLTENKVVTGTADAKRVENVGIKIKNAAEKYLNAHGYEGYLKDYVWEYKLVDNKELNAWCMPGGKIVFYTGILPVCQNDAGMATVMGHEVAHALANHGAQRMSAAQLQQIGGVGIAIATNGKSEATQQIWNQAYGLGTEVGVMLPFSRNHESEADMIGLILMAVAGYNPEEAIVFWERMSNSANGNKPPELLSTHPSDETRIAKLRNLVPKARIEARKLGVVLH